VQHALDFFVRLIVYILFNSLLIPRENKFRRRTSMAVAFASRIEQFRELVLCCWIELGVSEKEDGMGVE
jgi:hypothetical protein